MDEGTFPQVRRTVTMYITPGASSQIRVTATPISHVPLQVLTAFCNVLHILRPEKAPAFAYAWLDIVSHRVFIGRMLAVTPQHKVRSTTHPQSRNFSITGGVWCRSWIHVWLVGDCISVFRVMSLILYEYILSYSGYRSGSDLVIFLACFHWAGVFQFVCFTRSGL